MKEIRFFNKPNGQCPFIEWVEKLKDRKVAAMVKARLERVVLGNYGDHRSVGDEIYELRIHMNPGYRVYFAELGKNMVLILLGGNKPSQKRDLAKAKKYWQDFINLNEDSYEPKKS
jgi:putative addiction module killer protein